MNQETKTYIISKGNICLRFDGEGFVFKGSSEKLIQIIREYYAAHPAEPFEFSPTRKEIPQWLVDNLKPENTHILPSPRWPRVE